MWDWTWTCSLVYHQLFRLLVEGGDVGSSIMYYRWIPCIACICRGETNEDYGKLHQARLLSALLTDSTPPLTISRSCLASLTDPLVSDTPVVGVTGVAPCLHILNDLSY